jgi:hypothetical protein
LQIHLGPRPNIARAFAPHAREDSPPGTPGVGREVGVFYKQTHQKFRRWPYSIICVLAPLAVILSAFEIADWLIPKALWGLSDPWNETAHLLFSQHCKDNDWLDHLRTAVASATVRYTATYVALLTICLVTIGTSAVCTKNVLDTHNDFHSGLMRFTWHWNPRSRILSCEIASWLFSLVLPIVGGCTLFWFYRRLFGEHINELFVSRFASFFPYRYLYKK